MKDVVEIFRKKFSELASLETLAEKKSLEFNFNSFCNQALLVSSSYDFWQKLKAGSTVRSDKRVCFRLNSLLNFLRGRELNVDKDIVLAFLRDQVEAKNKRISRSDWGMYFRFWELNTQK